jgi:hypothetical protein
LVVSNIRPSMNLSSLSSTRKESSFQYRQPEWAYASSLAA